MNILEKILDGGESIVIEKAGAIDAAKKRAASDKKYYLKNVEKILTQKKQRAGLIRAKRNFFKAELQAFLEKIDIEYLRNTEFTSLIVKDKGITFNYSIFKDIRKNGNTKKR